MVLICVSPCPPEATGDLQSMEGKLHGGLGSKNKDMTPLALILPSSSVDKPKFLAVITRYKLFYVESDI